MDRYELVGEIASGGMATVYLARRAGVGGFQRFVAIKRLHAHLADEAEFVEMFLDEARLAALIHHPNVISITEVGANERGYYLVMDYVEGDTLARLMSIAAEQNTVVPIGIGLRIVVDMLTGLHASHELHDDQGRPLGLVHRDVSPQNVLVGVDGISRLSDFGVARAATRLAGTRVGQLKGKIAYMAPEQAAADEGIDRRADVFAAGIVLWEVLTGRRLFKSTNDAATLSRVVTERIEPPVSIIEGLDTRVSDICMKALERPILRRYQTAALFADQLEQTAGRRGLLATGKEVAAYVHKVLGDEITQQREAVRRWVAVSDCTDEMTPSGSVRALSSQPRGERFSSPPEAPPSSSHLRRLSNHPVINGAADDVTMAAPPPRTVWASYWPHVTIGLFVAFGLVVAVFVHRHRTQPVAITTSQPLSILGQAPAVTTPDETQALGVTLGAVPGGTLGAVPGGTPGVFAPSSVPTAASPWLSTAPASSVGTTKPRPLPTTKPPAITDVDLTNPYR